MKISKHISLVLVLLVIVFIVTTVQLYLIKLPTVDVTTRFILVGILSINVIALLTLMFFVGKSIFKLYTERQRKIMGYRFRTKLVFIFGILTLIPSLSLFVTASGLATNYMNRIFAPPMKEPLLESIELARSFYDFGREQVLISAQRVADGEPPISRLTTVRRLAVLPEDATELMKDAFNGTEGTEVISLKNGDIIRACVPDRVRGRKGIVVAELTLPPAISLRTERLKDVYEEYLKVDSFKEPLRLSYILILGFVTLLMVFAGLWVSLKVSQGITIPIQSLAMATEQIAGGNLDTQVKETSKDEIGLLTASFNQMVRQLKDNKASLQKAYEEANKGRLFQETILQNINSGVLFFDTTWHILTINKAACSMIKADPEEMIGKHYSDLINYLNSEDLVHMVKEMEGKEIRETSKEVQVTIQGTTSTLMIYTAAMRDPYTSKALGILVVVDDLTDVIKAQKMIAWQEMARRLAHEIKNPLTPIKLSTERLVKKWQQGDKHFDSTLEKSAKIIISEVESLRRLVDVFARYGTMPEIHKTPADLAECIESVAALYRGFGEVSIAISADLGLPLIPLDQEQFKRALMNLIDNAVKAMNNQGMISISVKMMQNSVIIDIADTGPGITNEEKDKLFIPYFSKTRGGTGLGLAIANKIVTDHSGKIVVSNNTPRGSVFTIELPL